MVALMAAMQVSPGHSHNHEPETPPQSEWCGTAAQYSSHGLETLRAVQASPVWLADHSIVELLPIIIKRYQSWSHIVLPVPLITPPLLGA